MGSARFYELSADDVGKRFLEDFTDDMYEGPDAERALHDIDTLDLMRFLIKHLFHTFLAKREEPDAQGPYRACMAALIARMPTPKREELIGDAAPRDCYPQVERYIQEVLGQDACAEMYRRAADEIRQRRDARRSRVAQFPALEKVPSSILYQFTQRAIARAPEGIFDSQGGFPSYTESKSGFNASLEMRPHEDIPISLIANYENILHSMTEKLNSLGDVAVDVMDIILARHLQNDEDTITLTTDEILMARGIKPKMKDGYSAGYRPEDKKIVMSIMNAMDNLWIVVGEMEVHIKGRSRPRRFREKSRLMMIYGIAEQQGGEEAEGFFPIAWRIRLGEVFEALMKGDIATQYALLSSKTLQYDPYRQKWEKRLSRYFHPLWRIRQSAGSYTQPFKVSTLLDAVGMQVDRRNPQKTKERLEAALDRLAQDRVISGWQYAIDVGAEDLIGRRGWVDVWMDWRVIVEPSDDVMEQYKKIKSGDVRAVRAMQAPQETTEVDLSAIRKRFGLTQLQLSEELGISRSLIAQIERGTRAMSPQVRSKVEKWEKGRQG